METSNENLTQVRRKIISQILDEGLVSAKALHSRRRAFLPSAGHGDGLCKEVSGNILNPKAPYRDIIYLLYTTLLSLFPVVTERSSGKIWPNTSELMEKRAASSLIVMAPVDKLVQDSSDYFEDDNIYMTGLSFPKGVKSKNFSHLLAPQDIFEESSDLLPTSNLRIIIIPDLVKRSLYNQEKVSGLVPNYETALHTIAGVINQQHWVHIVRLPVAND